MHATIASGSAAKRACSGFCKPEPNHRQIGRSCQGIMLPPDPPQHNDHDSVRNGEAHDPGSRRESRKIVPDVQPVVPSLRQVGWRGHRQLAFLRLLLLALSTIGVGTAFVLLVNGHSTLAARLLAGDVLLIFGILVIA